MIQLYRRTRIFVLIACAAVAFAGVLIVNAFAHHITVPCKGTLEPVPLAEVAPSTSQNEVFAGEASGLVFAYEIAAPYTKYSNGRVHWERSPGCACGDLMVPGAFSPSSDAIYRDSESGVFVVRRNRATPLLAFRKTEKAGRVFDHGKLVDAGDVAPLILLGAFGALGVALFRILRARSYVTRIHAWTPATVRTDGLVESESGAMMGRLGPRVNIVDGDVLVDPAFTEGRDVYREMPLFDRKDIAAGSHQRWTTGTLVRLRDARTLAVIATATTVLAVLANQFAG